MGLLVTRQRLGPGVACVVVPGGQGWAFGAGRQVLGREAGQDRSSSWE